MRERVRERVRVREREEKLSSTSVRISFNFNLLTSGKGKVGERKKGSLRCCKLGKMRTPVDNVIKLAPTPIVISVAVLINRRH